MTINVKTTRRNFLKAAAATSGGLLLGFHWAGASDGMKVISPADVAESDVAFNSYLSISPDDVVTLFSPNPELGQNIKTSFPMIVAEELDADWSRVVVKQAPLDTSKLSASSPEVAVLFRIAGTACAKRELRHVRC
jgi:Aerobic-type carbon monoxide dehydrogenase, large subunit CoxL/CutL homologs